MSREEEAGPQNDHKRISWLWIPLGMVLGVAIISLMYIISVPPRGQAIALLPAPTQAPFVVHVDGQVQQPGVYSVSPNARVQDAIDAAGGLTSNANTSTMNLAAKVSDGLKIYVPETNEISTIAVLPGQRSAGLGTNNAPLININTATQAELEQLPGIGPSKAVQIIAYREANGPFLSIEDIKNVSGIGDATFESIKLLITVNP